MHFGKGRHQRVSTAPPRRLLVLALAALLASAAVLALSGCDSKPDLPDIGAVSGSDDATGSAEEPLAGIDIEAYVPAAEWEAVGSYGGTSTEAKRLNILEPNTDYRLVCMVDDAPGDTPVSVTFWVEYAEAPLTDTVKVAEGSADGLELSVGAEVPPNGLRLVGESTGFAPWDVEVYKRK